MVQWHMFVTFRRGFFICWITLPGNLIILGFPNIKLCDTVEKILDFAVIKDH